MWIYTSDIIVSIPNECIFLKCTLSIYFLFACLEKEIVIPCILVWGTWEKNSAYATSVTEALAEFSWIFFNSLPK